MSYSIFSDKRLRIFFTVWWMVCMVLFYLLLKDIHADDKHAFADAFISTIFLAACCFFVSNNMRYYLPRKEKYWYILITSLGMSGLWILMQWMVLKLVLSSEDTYSSLIGNTWMIRYGAGFLVNSSISMFSMLWYSQQEEKTLYARKTETDKLAREAELYKLRQQLQPHFLFNSLNSISSLIGSHPEKARFMIQQLSDFLRGTIKKEEQAWNTLQEEVQYLELYLDIEKVRFGYRLQTRLNLAEETINLKIPTLLLQPVVENAIKFGLYDTTGDVVITLNAFLKDSYLYITVQNPFDPDTSQSLKGTGYGLTSISRRLFLLFGRQDLLSTTSNGTHFISTLQIPQI